MSFFFFFKEKNFPLSKEKKKAGKKVQFQNEDSNHKHHAATMKFTYIII